MKYVKICIQIENKKFEIYENVIAGTIEVAKGEKKIGIPYDFNCLWIINNPWKGEWEFDNYELCMNIENNEHIREYLISENRKPTIENYAFNK